MDTNKIDELALELNGIRNTILLLSDRFTTIKVDSLDVCGILDSVAGHIERISNDLDDISIQTVQ